VGLNIDMILRHLIRYCLPVNMGQANLPDVKVQQYEIIDSNHTTGQKIKTCAKAA
jgi:hypothetical protein